MYDSYITLTDFSPIDFSLNKTDVLVPKLALYIPKMDKS